MRSILGMVTIVPLNHDMGFVTRNPVFGASELDSNQPAKLQGLARVLKFLYIKQVRYYTFLKGNNKGLDQTARMRRLVCIFVVPMQQSQVFSR